MKNNINLVRYKKLLKLEENGKISFLDETFLELLDFRTNIQNQIAYNRKEIYFLVIEKYLNGIITPQKFRSKFIEMEREDSKALDVIQQDFQKLEVFTFSKNLNKFCDLKNKISILCMEYDEIFDGSLKPMSESEFYSLVNNQYSQLQKIFPNNLAYKNLIYRSFKILILIVVLEFLLILFTISNINS